jgi:hypothetical protein
MNNKKLIVPMLVLLVLFFVLQSCGGGGAGSSRSSSSTVSKQPEPPPKVLYLKNNIHTQTESSKTYRANYENWTNPGPGHVIFPVNTVVEIDYARMGFYIIEKKTGKKIDYEYNDRGMNGMSAEEYVSKIITSTEPISLKNLSDIDRKGVTEGKAYVGMSKDGVRIALGYPAVNRTPSLGSSTWVYAKNRWTSTDIIFDERGRVKSIK